jgi:myo-inositol-1(or 4)-monophosphatase
MPAKGLEGPGASPELTLIARVLREVSDYVHEQYGRRNQLMVTQKAHASDLLTEVDLTVQQRAMEAVAAHFPGDIFIGEEEGAASSTENTLARCWLMDPIDGTFNFVRGLLPTFAVSLAFCEGGAAQAAGVYMPGLRALFLAERGRGATRDGEPLQVSTVRDLAAASLALDVAQAEKRTALLSRAHDLLLRVGQVRALGSTVCAMCQVATGDGDAYLHGHITPWDFAATQLLVEEAGGMVTRLDGRPARVLDPVAGILVSNGVLHGLLVESLAQPR